MDQLNMFDTLKSNFKITKPVRLIELFAGIGTQAMALRELGVDFERYRVIEFDKYPLAAYNAIHGTDFPTMDICDVTGEELGIVDTDKYCYMMTYSFPCFTGDTLVLTNNGLKKISNVSVGDKVLAHDNNYHQVIASTKTGEKETYSIRGMAFDEIRCTSNHKFYAREMYREWENEKRSYSRKFKQPKWIECKDLNKNYYLGVGINQNSIIPQWEGIDFEWSDGRSTRHRNQLKCLMTNHSFWWIVGRWLGDGWFRTQGGIIISCDKKETIEIKTHLRNCGFLYSVAEEKTANKIHITLKEVQAFLEQFGKGAMHKHIPGFVFDMPIDLLESLVEGYISSGGCYTNGLYKTSSISRELIYGFAQIIAKVYKTPYRIYKCNRKSTHIIEGRTVNQNDTYELVWKIKKCKQDKAFYEDGYIWFPIRNIEPTNTVEVVYDVEVENAHSFMANGVIAHNCQDLSIAGNKKGMVKGSQTRSGLLWEVERLLNESKELPQVLIMENVTQVHSYKNIQDFNDWIKCLESKGYSNYWQDLNGKEYGVAQNRNRCFMVSILGDYKYDFPQPFELKKRLIDYLENNVDARYYISNDRATSLVNGLFEKRNEDK